VHYKDLLAIYVIAVVNAGMCDYHVRNCPPSPQLTEVCDEVGTRTRLFAAAPAAVPSHHVASPLFLQSQAWSALF